METKHTKGNWIVEETGKDIFVCPESDPASPICSLSWPFPKEKAQANAKLIAAAPELLEALKEIRNWYETEAHKYLCGKTPVCFSKGLSAIKKATE